MYKLLQLIHTYIVLWECSKDVTKYSSLHTDAMLTGECIDAVEADALMTKVSCKEVVKPSRRGAVAKVLRKFRRS